jgi:thioredoxin reductase
MPAAPRSSTTHDRAIAGESDFDVVIVGGGAAGLSAALVLSRARRRVLVVDAGAPRNAPAAHMHGFLSRDDLPPQELLAIGRAEITAYGTQITSDAVIDVEPGTPGGFRVDLASGQHASARHLLIATGLRDELPPIAGLRERWARDVLHCPYCHGWEVRDRALGVLADGSPESVRYAHLVRQWSADLVLFVPQGALSADERRTLAARAITLVEGTPDQVRVADDRLVGVQLDDGRLVHRDVLFVPPRLVPTDQLLVRLGCDLEAGWVVKDDMGRTTIPGVWVAGNVANPRAQVVTAAGEGSAAAIAMNADLVSEDVALAVANSAH